MATTDFNLEAYTDNDSLDLIERENWEQERKQIAHQLHLDLAMPLPDDPEGKQEALQRRGANFDTLRVLNNKLSPREMPQLQDAPSREKTDTYQPEFLIDNWMPANRLTMLTGPGGTGKSYLALQHVVGLAMGVADHQLKPCHGNIEDEATITPDPFRKDPIKVVIASYEEDLQETWKRIARICDWLGWPDYDHLVNQIRFVDLRMFGPIWGVEQDTHLAIRAKLLEIGDWLLSESQAFGARLLMLDPSAGAFGASEISRESVREFCSYLNGWGQAVNCATLLIAHPPKSGEDYSGSTDWLGSCRAMWTLKVEKEQKREWYQLTNVKQNYAAPQRDVPLRKIENTTESRWTPIWEKCSQPKAEAFYQQYQNPTPTHSPETKESIDGTNIDDIRFDV